MQNIEPHAFRNGGEGISNYNMGWSSFPTLGTTNKSGSLHVLNVGHKCDESPQEVQDGGGPIWCAMPTKKSWRLNEKVEQLHEQKVKQPPPCSHKTSSVYNVNHKSCQI